MARGKRPTSESPRLRIVTSGRHSKPADPPPKAKIRPGPRPNNPDYLATVAQLEASLPKAKLTPSRRPDAAIDSPAPSTRKPKPIGRRLSLASARASNPKPKSPHAPAAPARPISVKPNQIRQLELAMTLLKRGIRGGVPRSELLAISGYHPPGHSIERQGKFTSDGHSKFDRMLQRDLRDLEAIGLRVTTSSGDGSETVYGIDPDSLLTDLIDLDFVEIMLLDELTAEFGAAIPDRSLREALASAVVRLKAGLAGMGMPDSIRKAAIQRTLAPRTAESQRLTSLQRAHRKRLPVRFLYRGPGAPRSTLRTIEPWSIIRRGSRTYVIGRDRSVTEGDPVRNFRLSRIRGEVTIIGSGTGGKASPSRRVSRNTPFTIPADFDPDTYFSAEPLTPGEYHRLESVTIDFDADVGFIIANLFTHRHMVKEAADGSVTLHLRTAAPGELWEFLSEFVGHFRIRKARGVTHALRERIENTLAVYYTPDGMAGR